MSAIKPGTRCECPQCKDPATKAVHSVVSGPSRKNRQCTRDAVRMVAIDLDWPVEHEGRATTREIPMCAPCAEYAERAK